MVVPSYRKREFGHEDDFVEVYGIPTDCPECYVQVQYWSALEERPVVGISLVSTHWNPDVWHSWRYKLRAMRAMLLGRWDGIDITLHSRADVEALIAVLQQQVDKMEDR